jgi:hypothetical protein
MAYTPEQSRINLKRLEKSTFSSLNDNPVGTYYLADNPKYYEPQRTNTFTFYVSDLNGILKDYNVKDLTTDGSEEKALELSVKASSVPHFSIGKISINRGNSQMHFAGKPEFRDGQITVQDYIGAHTKEILMAWQRRAYNVMTEKVGLASDYKHDAYLLEYTPEYQLVRTWILRGCWVQNIDEGEYNHDSTEAKTMNVTIVYDKAYIDFSDSEVLA